MGKQGERLKGIEGLAMLLVDVDYDGEIFDMGITVFARGYRSGWNDKVSRFDGECRGYRN